MQSENNYFYHYNVFVRNHDFEKVFYKIADASLVFDVLDNNLCLYIVDVKIFLLLFVYLIQYKTSLSSNS